MLQMVHMKTAALCDAVVAYAAVTESIGCILSLWQTCLVHLNDASGEQCAAVAKCSEIAIITMSKFRVSK